MTTGLPTPRQAVAEGDALTSVIVPVRNVTRDLPAARAALLNAPSRLRHAYEFIFVVEGSAAGDVPGLAELARGNSRLRLLSLSEPFGEAMTVRAGVDHSSGDTIVALSDPAELDPEELDRVVDSLTRDVDLVVVRRRSPRGGWLHKLRVYVFNVVVRMVARIRLSETAPHLQAMRRHVALSIPLYGSANRVFPSLAAYHGLRVVEIERPSAPSRSSDVGWTDDIVVFTDALTLLFVSRFVDRPLRFFGPIGAVLGAAGAVLALVLAYQRLFLGQGIADRPLLLLAVLLVAVGIQVIGLGLVGEIIVNLRSPDFRSYTVETIV